MRAPATLAILASTVIARAQPVATGGEPAPRPQESPTRPAPPAEPDWEAASSPRDASGVVRDDARSGTERALWIPRSLLFLPRMAVWLVGQPLRGAAYAYEAYDGPSGSIGSSGKRSIGGAPAIVYESGFGLTVGGRVSVRPIGDGERVELRADFFGRFRQAYGVGIATGTWRGHHLELAASYEQRPQERFFGIGNRDAAELRYAETRTGGGLTVDTRIAGDLHARTSGAVMLRDLADTAVIDEALVYDTRRPSKYQSKAFASTGWYARVHGGVARGIDGDPSEFAAVGGELQRYFDLYDGSRVLVLRVLVEVVDGTLAFVDLPQLGGARDLRGYPDGRFRDRAVGLGSAEYRWDLGNFLAAFAFVDAGRPLEDGPLRVGYGGGIEVHTSDRLLARMLIAGSRDGDFLLQLAVLR